jgi:hypothetical protein
VGGDDDKLMTRGIKVSHGGTPDLDGTRFSEKVDMAISCAYQFFQHSPITRLAVSHGAPESEHYDLAWQDVTS